MLRFFRRKPPPALDAATRTLIEARVPHVAGLPPELRARHDARAAEFLRRVRFHGCDGLEVTDEMRALVSGIAALLVLRPDDRGYANLRSVLLYPSAFWVRHEEPDELGLVSDDEVLQLGESHDWGRVVLSWEDVEAALDGDEVNVPAHEFAHQLDEENPGTEGAPRLPEYTRWSAVMRAEYDALCARGSAVLDDYGAEGPAEFFAVATESYFQRGLELRRHHPQLYQLLNDYYRVDTAATGGTPPGHAGSKSRLTTQGK